MNTQTILYDNKWHKATIELRAKYYALTDAIIDLEGTRFNKPLSNSLINALEHSHQCTSELEELITKLENSEPKL